MLRHHPQMLRHHPRTSVAFYRVKDTMLQQERLFFAASQQWGGGHPVAASVPST